MSKGFLLFSGSCHPDLAKLIADYRGVSLGKASLNTFSDGEISVQIHESVAGKDVFVLQPIAIDPNFYLMELLVMIDALKRSFARSITAIIPYFGYCRQDRQDRKGVPITAKLVANLLETAGADRIIAMDLHSEQLQGFFNVPVEVLHAKELIATKISGKDCAIVAPDAGSVKIARSFADVLGCKFALIDKKKDASFELIGSVLGKNVLIVDDICSTGRTLIGAAECCIKSKAKTVKAAVVHGIFAGDALEKINLSPIEEVIVTDTLPINRLNNTDKLRFVTVSNLFGGL